MADVVRKLLSGSSDGLPIKVVSTGPTGSSGTLIHTAVAGSGLFDEPYLWAWNNHTAAVLLTIQYGGITADEEIEITLEPNQPPIRICDGMSLNNAKVIRAFGAVANVCFIGGHVNEITN